jgi:hypothetical protein
MARFFIATDSSLINTESHLTGEPMQVQTIAFFINDPLMLPCVMQHYLPVFELLEPATSSAVGIAHFEMGEPLLAKVHPDTHSNPTANLSHIVGNAALVAVMGNGGESVHSYDLQPYRYRNWVFVMAGGLRSLPPEARAHLAIPEYIEANIRGEKVPEVLFHQYLAFLHRQGLLAGDRWDLSPLRKALAAALSHENVWFGDSSGGHSLVLSDGRILVGASIERSVHVHIIEGIGGCTACGQDVDGCPVDHGHVRGVVVVDTDRLPPQDWQTVGPGNIFQVDREFNFESFSL